MSARIEGPELAAAVLRWAGYEETVERALPKLVRLAEWLASEGIASGGLGPNEVRRLWSRHIGDSLTFLAGLEAVDSIVDIGTGIGLPGIPLAVAQPATEFVLVDRSDKRCRLVRRVSAILELPNVTVIHGDAQHMSLAAQGAVSRAFQQPDRLLQTVRSLLPQGRFVVSAGSFGTSAPVELAGWDIIEVPPHLLGHASWLLKASLSE